jgi:uncharacterized membrane protein
MIFFGDFHEHFQRTLWRVGIVIHCHQRPERSFFLKRRQVPICARCLGVMIGATLIPLYSRDLHLAIALIATMLFDGGTQLLRLRESTNSLRFITGIGFALGCGGFIIRIGAILWNT